MRFQLKYLLIYLVIIQSACEIHHFIDSLRYTTGSIPLYFPVITCAQQFTGVHLRTPQKPAAKLFNSCEPLRLTFPITSGDFPKISEHFRRFPKILKNHKNIWKLFLNRFRSFPKISEDFRTLLKISEDFPKILKNYKTSGKHFWTVSEAFRKFHKSFTGLKRFQSFQKFVDISEPFSKFPKI